MPRRGHLLALPEPGLVLEQDAEWFLVQLEDQWQQIRFHDYERIYRVPGLYEHLFYELLGCCSPKVVCRHLQAQLDRAGCEAAGLRVLDLGAGNGMVGEEIAAMGAEWIVGLDINPAAALAAHRDRPHVYHDYWIADLVTLEEFQRRRLETHRFNCLTCVAALGFGDIPVEAFKAAFNLIETGGWIAFNIKEEFLRDAQQSPFAALIHRMVDCGALSVLEKQRYRHRFSTAGEALHYVAIIGRKTSPASQLKLQAGREPAPRA